MLRSSSSKPSLPDQEVKASVGQSPWSSKTPEKPVNPPRRVRNRRAAFSVKKVREAAAKLQKPDQNWSHLSDAGSSVGRQIDSELDKTPIVKTKKKVDASMKLPEKFEMLGKFFDSLDSAIRLLRLKSSICTFTNICPKVECLTDRRFSHGHLAQLKFILPEVIELKKILVHDERTSCMRPDLYITLNLDAIKNEGKPATQNSHLRKVFRARLLEFFEAHPESEVPEEKLPEPFNRSKQDLQASTITAKPPLLREASRDTLAEQPPVAVSHLSHSFRKHFSQRILSQDTKHGRQEETVASQPPEEKTIPFASPSVKKFSSKPTTRKKSLSHVDAQASLPATPIKEIDTAKKEVCSLVENANTQGTPARLSSTPMKLMSATPALRPPKRCYMSPEDSSTSSPNKLIRRPPRSRSLKFDTPVKNAKVEDEFDTGGLSIDDDVFDILPENLLQSIREKERKALEEQDPAISRAKWRREMIANLPKLYDKIHFFFQSINRSVVAKEELMHRIMASQLDIVDRREVEEQLRLLLELVPEWICEKSASSGDLLVCINKISSPKSIRLRLMEAK